jgi:hypothetical protein
MFIPQQNKKKKDRTLKPRDASMSPMTPCAVAISLRMTKNVGHKRLGNGSSDVFYHHSSWLFTVKVTAIIEDGQASRYSYDRRYAFVQERGKMMMLFDLFWFSSMCRQGDGVDPTT